MPQPIRQTTRPPTRTTKSETVLSRIAPIGFDDDSGIKILLYGKSGTGKTTLWATFPAPILCLICSGGEKSGELRSVDTPANRKRISSVTVGHSSEVREVVDHVKTTGAFKTVVLDHASGLQDLTLKEILGLEELPAQKSWGMASQQQYGQSSLMTKEMLRALLSLPTNVVIISQERVFNGSDDGGSEIIKPTVGAALTPSVTGWLNPACDYVCQTFIRPETEETSHTVGVGKTQKTVTSTRKTGKVEYCLRTEPHEVFMTKFRIPGGVKQSVIVNPTYDKIMSAIRGEEST